MNARGVYIFLTGAVAERIEEVRSRYDPLYGLIPPHLSLVFPFYSEDSDQAIVEHVRAVLLKRKAFEMTLSGISESEGRYLFLNVTKGKGEIIGMHDRLYTGILREHWKKELGYVPHVTIGRFNNSTELTPAGAFAREKELEFTVPVREIFIEEVDSDEHSRIIERIVLRR